MKYYAISEEELRSFHLAGMLTGAKKEVGPVVASIREREISWPAVEQRADNSASAPCKHCKWHLDSDNIHLCLKCRWSYGDKFERRT